MKQCNLDSSYNTNSRLPNAIIMTIPLIRIPLNEFDIFSNLHAPLEIVRHIDELQEASLTWNINAGILQ